MRLRDGTVRATSKDLVRSVTGAAGAIACRQTKRHVAGKGDAVRLYCEAVGGEWAPLVEAIDQTCRVEFQYLIPNDATGRARLRDLCGRALAFESHFLGVFRDVLLEDIAGPSDLGDLPDWAQRLPVERRPGRNVFFLEAAADEVQAWASAGALPSTWRDEQLLLPIAPCLQVAAARMLGRVVYPEDPAVPRALATAATSAVPALRTAAQESARAYPVER